MRKFKDRERLIEKMSSEMQENVNKVSKDFKKRFDGRLKEGHYAVSPRQLLKNTFSTFYQPIFKGKGFTFQDFCLILNINEDDYSDELPKDAYENER